MKYISVFLCASVCAHAGKQLKLMIKVSAFIQRKRRCLKFNQKGSDENDRNGNESWYVLITTSSSEITLKSGSYVMNMITLFTVLSSNAIYLWGPWKQRQSLPALWRSWRHSSGLQLNPSKIWQTRGH